MNEGLVGWVFGKVLSRQLKKDKKLILLFTLFTMTSCIDVKPNVTVDQTIDLHIDGENVEGLEGEWIISADEKDDVITVKIERKEELSE